MQDKDIGRSSNGMEYHTVSARSEVRFAGRSSNGRTAAFEAVNLGSIPSLPAKRISLLFRSPVFLKEGACQFNLDML
jgi:hypothetical protein